MAIYWDLVSDVDALADWDSVGVLPPAVLGGVLAMRPRLRASIDARPRLGAAALQVWPRLRGAVVGVPA